MEILLLGYEISAGTFTNQQGKDIDYNNFKVHCAIPLNSDSGAGYQTYQAKLKNSPEVLKELSSYSLPSKVNGIFKDFVNSKGGIESKLVSIEPLKK